MKLRKTILEDIEQHKINEKMLEDNDLAVIGKPREALETIKKNQMLISRLDDGTVEYLVPRPEGGCSRKF